MNEITNFVNMLFGENGLIVLAFLLFISKNIYIISLEFKHQGERIDHNTQKINLNELTSQELKERVEKIELELQKNEMELENIKNIINENLKK